MDVRRPSLFTRLFGPASIQRQPADVIALCHALMSEKGEVSGSRLANEVVAAYNPLSPAGQNVFFSLLVEQFSPDQRAIAKAADAFKADPSDNNLFRLQEAVEPPRQELFRRFNIATGGTASARRDAAARCCATLETHPTGTARRGSAHLFRSWFNRGFLTCSASTGARSALVLERLIRYEAVHRSTAGPICAAGSRPTGAASRSSIRRCPTSR